MISVTLCVVALLASMGAALPQGRKISDKKADAMDSQIHSACEVRNETGLCMYQWECFHSGGTPLGICKHGFQFGACCKHDSQSNEVMTSSSLTEAAPIKGDLQTTTPSSDLTTTNGEPDHVTTPAGEPIEVTTPAGEPTEVTTPPEEPSEVTTPAGEPNEVTTPKVGSTEVTTPAEVTTSSGEPSEVTTPKVEPSEVTTPTLQPSDIIDTHTNHECGVQSKPATKTGRIVNGTQTFGGEVPWQVSVMLYRGIGTGFEHHCGGVLLNRKWVATAAHCVARNLLVEIQVRAGEHDLLYEDRFQPHRNFKVIRKVIHPDYLSNSDYFRLTYENDIALLELKDEVRFKRNIVPICLPGSDDLLVGRTAMVTGWGKNERDGKLTNILQKVSLPVLSNADCEAAYDEAGIPQSIPEIFVCAGFVEGGSDACNGDSGGPLQTRASDGRYVFSGIVSWGNGCGEKNKPGVYTRVSKFVPWILQNIDPAQR